MKIVFEDGEAKLAKAEPGPPGDNQLLVQARCSLISPGTEVAHLTERVDDPWFRQNPGYALAGDVVQMGDRVSGFAVGDRVIALRNHASLNVVSADPWETLPIPAGVTYEQATFVPLLSVAMHGLRRARLELGEAIAIYGAGLLGLLAIQLARLDGAEQVIAIDLAPDRLDWATRVGADLALSPTDEGFRARIAEATHGKGPSIILEATGNSRVIPEALKIAAAGGRIVCTGTMPEKVEMDLFTEFIRKELNLIAAFQPLCPTADNLYYRWPQQENRRLALRLLARGALRVDELITHRFRYREAPAAYERLRQGDRSTIGVLFDWRAGHD